MRAGAWPSRGSVGVVLPSFHPASRSQAGPDAPASHVAPASGLPPKAAAPLHRGAIVGFWQEVGGPAFDTDLRLDGGWR